MYCQGTKTGAAGPYLRRLASASSPAGDGFRKGRPSCSMIVTSQAGAEQHERLPRVLLRQVRFYKRQQSSIKLSSDLGAILRAALAAADRRHPVNSWLCRLWEQRSKAKGLARVTPAIPNKSVLPGAPSDSKGLAAQQTQTQT